MKRKQTHAMTLRLDPQLDELLTNASYDAHVTKAAWTRRAILQSLGTKWLNRPATQEPVLR